MNVPVSIQEQVAKLSPAERARLNARLAELSGGHAPAPGPEIPRRRADAPAPLAYNQEILWALDQAIPDLTAYNVPRVLRIHGPLDLNSLRSALNGLVERHQVLRTRISIVDGAPVQSVAPPGAVPFTLQDLSSLEVDARSPALERMIQAGIAYHFDLASDLLLRATVIRLGAADHVLLLLTHHIVCDEWSREVLYRDLGVLYAAARNGQEAQLPALPIQFADYAAWQRTAVHEAGMARDLAFWRERLANLPTLEVPTDYPRTGLPSFRGTRHRFDLPTPLIEQARVLARAEGTTLYVALLTAYIALLQRYSGQTDIVVGTPVSTRSHEELENLVGYFPNTLILRASLDGDPSFRTLMRRVRELYLDAFEHRNVPLEQLALEVSDHGRPRTEPLFRVNFQSQEGVPVGARLDGAEVTPMPVDFGTAKFELLLAIHETPGGWRGAAEYRTDLFDGGTIERLVGHYQHLLGSAMAAPDLPVSRLDILPREERKLILEDWNQTARPYPRHATLPDLLEATAARVPNDLALRGGGDQVSFAALDARANAMARHLQGLGVGPGVLVGVFMERSPALVIALLGIMKAGGAYVPIDPTYPRARIGFMLQDSGAPVLLTQARLLDRLPGSTPALLVLDEAGWPVEAPAPTEFSRPERRLGPDDLAYVIYTSGSTGTPKGAMLPHRGLVNYLAWAVQAYEIQGGNGAPVHSSIAFDLTITSLWAPLVAGKPAILLPDALGVEALAEALRTSRDLSLIKITPAHLELLRNQLTPEQAAGRVRTIVIGGENLVGEALAFWQSASPDTVLVNEYGPTETVVGCCVEFVRGGDPIAGSVPIGRPIANTRLYVLDRLGQPVPIGVIGELFIGGDGVGLGYLNRPEQSAVAFLPDPFVPGGRMYRTGDRARYRADSRLEFLGRLDEQIKIRGYRIEPGEVEAVLAQHPAVEEAAVVARTNGDGTARLVAYLVGSRGATQDPVPAADTVEKWAMVFDETYSNRGVQTPAEIRLAGWDSSYTQQPLPAAEMIEWVEETCRRIRAQEPRRVLEIGCGTGLLLLRLAPACESYSAIDFSRAALDVVRAAPSFPTLDNVTLHQRSATQLDGFPAASFDTVVINSVVQYFPSVDYLLEVMTGALALLRPGGSLFVGDVRSLPHLTAFHGSVAAFQAPPGVTAGALRERVAQRLALETELVIDPGFFHALRARVPSISAVEVRPKLGRARNELTKYRYDVVIRVHASGRRPEIASVPAFTPRDLEDVRSRLREQPLLLHLAGMRDRRLERDLRLHAALGHADAGQLAGAISAAVDGGHDRGIEPGDLAALDPAYEADIFWPAAAEPGCFDAILRHRERCRAAPALPSGRPGAGRPWSDYVHAGVPPALGGSELAELKAFLSERVPAYMVPSAFVRMAALPLTPNGKVDRTRLPPLTSAHRDTEYVAPRSEREAAMAAIWSDVLRLDRVSVEDGFVELGGHSLQAMRVIGTARRQLGLNVGLGHLLRGMTIAALCDLPLISPEDGGIESVSRASYSKKEGER